VGGATVTAHQVDVSDKTQMAAFASDVIEAHGEAHILINNAGVTVYASFEEHNLEDLEWIIGVNLWGVIYGCKFFLPHLKAAGEGHIVNLSSVFGIIAPPLQTSYVATKFAVRGFSESLRAELADENIGVRTPAWSRTPTRSSATRHSVFSIDSARRLMSWPRGSSKPSSTTRPAF
jgi:NADP-dependent 3-hydroxy acid dehydrogenase YdfG